MTVAQVLDFTLAELRLCTRCGQNKSLCDFNRKGGGWQVRCRECSAWIQLEIRYNITQAEYEAKLEAQNGVCAICFQPELRYTRLSVDHDHNCCPPYRGRNNQKPCGKCNRGLLCSRCNPLIGYANYNIAVLKSAIQYLRER